MTKSELIKVVSGKLKDFSQAELKIIIDHIFETICQKLEEGDKIEIRGFGTFNVRKHKERVAHNPKTGEKIYVPEKNIPFFNTGKKMRDKINTF